MDRDKPTAERPSVSRLDSRLRVYRGVTLLGLASLLGATLAAWLPGVHLFQQPDKPGTTVPAYAPSCGCRSSQTDGAAAAAPRRADSSYTVRRSRPGRAGASAPLRLKHSAQESADADDRGAGAGISPHAELYRPEQRDYEANFDGFLR